MFISILFSACQTTVYTEDKFTTEALTFASVCPLVPVWLLLGHNLAIKYLRKNNVC